MAENNIGKKVGDELEEDVEAVKSALGEPEEEKEKKQPDDLNSINPNNMTEKEIDEKIRELQEQYEKTTDEDEKEGIMQKIDELTAAKKRMRDGKNGILNFLDKDKEAPGMEDGLVQ